MLWARSCPRGSCGKISNNCLIAILYCSKVYRCSSWVRDSHYWWQCRCIGNAGFSITTFSTSSKKFVQKFHYLYVEKNRKQQSTNIEHQRKIVALAEPREWEFMLVLLPIPSCPLESYYGHHVRERKRVRAEVLAVGNGRMVLHWMHCLKANRPLERKGKGGRKGEGNRRYYLW